jgi:phosphatidylserine/phosphatidylglycerophosphate/cardiolipin synthase-like enzyme
MIGAKTFPGFLKIKGQMMANVSDSAVDTLIHKNLNKLRKPGVLAVRPGYEIAGHQLTGRRAVVATVQTKKPKVALARGETLPETLGGMPVDVREARAYQRLRAIDPLAAEVSEAYERPENKEPSWPLEREMPSGEYVTSPKSNVQKTMKAQHAVQPHAAAILQQQGQGQGTYVPYKPTGCPPLVSITLQADFTLAVSPQEGYGVLSQYLAATQKSLVVGMYDFTSGPLLLDVTNAASAHGSLQMVLDNPAPNQTADQSDRGTVETLESKLGSRAHIARALTRGDHFATHWSFPYAYHIKVIVRDADAVWLSSGNLNNSNEPAPGHAPTHMDRDWHVVVENVRGASPSNLVDVFTQYLDYDFSTASKYQAPNPGAAERAIEEARQKRQRESNPTGVKEYSSKQGPAKNDGAVPKPAQGLQYSKKLPNLKMTVLPLLTPDQVGGGQGQYLSAIMNLINSSQKSIYIQLQYIEASKDKTSPYGALLQAIANKIAAGLDVQLIVSADYAEKWGELMRSQTGGVDLTENIRTQPNVHNKGFIVDELHVIVSSQNFSPAGVQNNRDAGVLMESQDVAQFFLPIFKADLAGSLALTVQAGQPGKKRGAARAGKRKTARSKK